MRVALVAALLTVSVARADAPAPIGAVAVIDRPVAVVGTTVIWQSQVDDKLFGRKDANAARPQAIEDLIDEVLYLRRARELNILVDKSEVLAALDEIKNQNNIDDAKLDELLKEQGYTRARYLIDLEHQLLILRLRNQDLRIPIVSDAEIEAEAKQRGVKLPLAEDDRQRIRSEMRLKRLDAVVPVWRANLRKRAHIERKP